MLTNIKLTYFRKHRDISLDFSDGLNIIKAGNEAGKSTVVEGLGYNWFGSSALRQPLKEVVTKGEKVSKLQTETSVTFNGTSYRVTRSSKGAEVYLGGNEEPAVTGQKEVTAYMEDLFGIPAGKASALIIAEQGDIRGVLAKGAADTAKFIESLANFEDIDLLVNKVQNTLSFGSNQPEKDRLLSAEDALSALEAVTLPDEEALKSAKAELNNREAEEAQKLETLTGELASIDEVVFANNNNKIMRDGLLSQMRESVTALAKLGDEPCAPITQYDAEKHKHVGDRLDVISPLISKSVDDLVALAEFNKLDICEDVWDEPYQSLLGEIQAAKDIGAGLIGDIAGLKASMKARQLSLLSGDSCPTCGSKPDTAAIEHNNSEIAIFVSTCKKSISEAEAKQREQQEYLTVLLSIQNSQERINTFIQIFPGNIDGGPDTQVPVAVNFVGWDHHPVELVDELEHLNQENESFMEAKTALETYETACTKYQAETDRIAAGKQVAEKALASVPEDKQVQSPNEIHPKIEAVNAMIQTTRASIDKLDEDYRESKAKFDLYETESARATSALKQAKSALKEKDLANLLLKDIRTARLSVTNKIWGTMLKVVSVYFSKMRGEASEVTRGEKNFLVNGESIKGLSGSTLDILGLAFRIAQSELFLSGCPVLFLDEATAGCDLDRASSMIGLLGGAVDKQCVLITHSEVGPDVCETLITLGGEKV